MNHKGFQPLSKSRNRINELYEIIRKSNEELNAIRRGCSHDSYKVAYYSYRIGQRSPTRTCDTCDQPLTGLTVEELGEFLKAEEAK